MTDFIEIQDENKIRIIRINRPATKNALTQEMYAVMAEGVVSAQHDDTIRVVAITGSGDAFTAGNDLADFAQRPPDTTAAEVPPVQKFLTAILEAEKPLVAIVNGVAVGIGATMLLHCDFAYAARSAKISAPFVDLGLVPEAGSSLLMPMIAGSRRAAELFMLGARLTAEDAVECGLVTRIFDDDTLYTETKKILEVIATKAPSAMRQTKALLKKNRVAAGERMMEEGALFTQALKGPEFAEAASAFMQKRAANFDGFK